MRLLSGLLAAALLLPAAHAAPKRYTIDDFLATTSMGGASFSADEKRVLFSSNQTGIFNAYVIDTSGGTPRALTQSTTDTTRALAFFPEDDRILYTRDQGGNENNHVYVRELDGAERDLTPGGKLKARFGGFRPDGKVFYVESNERDPKAFDLYRYDTKTYERTLVYRNEQAMEIGAISRDEKWLSLDKPHTTNDSDVFVVELATGRMRKVTPHQGNVSNGSAAFDPASRRLLFLSDEGGEFKSVRSYDLASGEVKVHEKADWDILYTYYSRDGRYRVTGVNADGSTQIRVVEGPDEKPVALPRLPDGEIRGLAFSKSGQRMAFYVNGDRAPSDLHVYDFGTKQVTRLTRALSPRIDAADLVDAQVVRFRSFDGMVIPSIYYKPQDASATSKMPAVVLVHGGPGGQSTRGYSALAQFLANHGYAVLAINNRGSSGYGKTFFAADDHRHGREPLWDCIEAKTFLAATGHVDPERIAIMGGSYGGYMTLSALAFRPEAFKVGVDVFGVSNWLRTLESIPPYWESFRKALYAEVGDPVADRDFLMATSPLFHAANIRVPLLVIQGANDPRVIKPESDEIVEAVKKNKVPVEYVVFPDEGHGFTKKANERKAWQTTLEFLDKYLKK